jgi:hypothetical protein
VNKQKKNMRIKFCYVMVFLLTSLTNLIAQERLLMLSGKELLIQPNSLKEDSAKLEYNDFLKGKKRSLKKDNVFSYKNEKGYEKVFYREDSTSVNNDLSISEMRSYIQGEQEARKYYKAPFATVGSFLIGSGSGYFLYFYSLIPPGAYITIIGNHLPKMKDQKVSDPELLNNSMFVNGYQKRCNEKKIQNAVIGSLAGILTGAVLHQLLK